MDKATKALAQRVANLEKIVHRHIELANAPGEQNEKSRNQQYDPNQEHAAAEIHPIVASKATPAADHPKRPNKRWYRRIPWWKGLEGIGLAAGITYAVVTYLQWRDIGHNFVVDERAWIGPSNIVMNQFKVGEDILAGVVLKNTGKTPGSLEFKALLVPFPGKKERDGYIEHNQEWKTMGSTVMTIFPGDFRTMLVKFTTTDEYTILHVLVPDLLPKFPTMKPMEFTIMGVTIMKMLRLTLVGEVNYRDIFDKRHLTKFCAVYDASRNLFVTCSEDYRYAEYAD